jgi:hypothetical protein
MCMYDTYFKTHYANMLFAGNAKIVRSIKSVEPANYQRLTEHGFV